MIDKKLLLQIFDEARKANSHIAELTDILEEQEEDEIEVAAEFAAMLLNVKSKSSAPATVQKPKNSASKPIKNKPLADAKAAMENVLELCTQNPENITKNQLRICLKNARDKLEAFIEVVNKHAGIIEDAADVATALQTYADKFRTLSPSSEVIFEAAEPAPKTSAAVIFSAKKPGVPVAPKAKPVLNENDLYGIVAKYGSQGNGLVGPAVFKTNYHDGNKSNFIIFNLLFEDDKKSIEGHLRIDSTLVPKYQDEKWHLTLAIKHPSKRNSTAVVHFYYSSKPFPRLTSTPAHPNNFAVQSFSRGHIGYLGVAPEYEEDAQIFKDIAKQFIDETLEVALQDANAMLPPATPKIAPSFN